MAPVQENYHDQNPYEQTWVDISRVEKQEAARRQRIGQLDGEMVVLDDLLKELEELNLHGANTVPGYLRARIAAHTSSGDQDSIISDMTPVEAIELVFDQQDPKMDERCGLKGYERHVESDEEALVAHAGTLAPLVYEEELAELRREAEVNDEEARLCAVRGLLRLRFAQYGIGTRAHDIAEELSVPKKNVVAILQQLKRSGQVDKVGWGLWGPVVVAEGDAEATSPDAS